MRADECRRGNPVKNAAPPCCHAELRERAEAQSENVKSICHAELADLRTVERSENRLASRLSLLEQSSLGETLRAWSKSKTVSASIRRCVLPVTLARSRNKFGMSLAERLPQLNPSKNLAFTMAEILLSLTIIGVVAAITLPSLTGNINERTWNTQRKALYARFSQAIALMPALNGYGTLQEESSSGASDAVDTAAETFVTNGLSKVLKLNNICDSEHLSDCGIPDKIIPYSGSPISPVPKTLVELNNYFNYNSGVGSDGVVHSYSQIDTKAAAFETANGESVIVYYNPYCRTDTSYETHYIQPYMCANFVYDLNGTKGPNTFGKDIGFITVFNSVDSVIVAPYPLARDLNSKYSVSEASKHCRELDSESRLPTHDELKAIFVNKNLIGGIGTSGYYYISSSLIAPGTSWHLSVYDGTIYPHESKGYVRCVKRN